jgi:hypothetical protein
MMFKSIGSLVLLKILTLKLLLEMLLDAMPEETVGVV